MSVLPDLAPGLTAEASFRVTEADSAPHLGSGDLAVLATPRMVAWVERTCAELTQRYLPSERSTVGVMLRVEHLVPTPVGGQVKVAVELTGVEGERLTFRAQISDASELVGRIDHQRFIVDRERFLRRVRAKAS